MVKIKRAPVAGLHLLEGEIVKKDLKISGMSFKNVPVIPEVKNDDTRLAITFLNLSTSVFIRCFAVVVPKLLILTILHSKYEYQT